MKVEELFAMMLRVLRVARIALAYKSSAGLYASDKKSIGWQGNILQECHIHLGLGDKA